MKITNTPTEKSDLFWLAAIIVLICVFLAGCGTRIYSPDGKPRFTTTANLQAKNIRVGDFSADELTLDHATPFKAIGDIVNQALTLAGAGAFLR